MDKQLPWKNIVETIPIRYIARNMHALCVVMCLIVLTHSSRVTHICISKINSAWSAPSHYLNRCRDIVKLALRNKLQWKIYPSSYTFIHENAFDSVVCEISAIFLGINVLSYWSIVFISSRITPLKLTLMSSKTKGQNMSKIRMSSLYTRHIPNKTKHKKVYPNVMRHTAVLRLHCTVYSMISICLSIYARVTSLYWHTHILLFSGYFIEYIP